MTKKFSIILMVMMACTLAEAQFKIKDTQKATVMIVTNDGDVGIGIGDATPAATLDIDGDVRVGTVTTKTGTSDESVMIWDATSQKLMKRTLTSDIWDGDDIDDADHVIGNEFQNLAISGNTLSISNGNSITLPTGSDNQQLSVSGHTLTLERGGSVTLPDNVNDADYVIGNEFQDLGSSRTGTNVTVSITDGTNTSFSVADNDNSSSNEIQTLSLSGTTLSISGGNNVTLPTGSDNQQLSISGHTLTLERGGNVTLPDNVNDADHVIGNEFQNLGSSKSGTNVTVSITDGTNTSFSVADNDNDATNEFQDLSNTKSGENVTVAITNGTNTTFNVRDGDYSTTNETPQAGTATAVSGRTVNVRYDNSTIKVNGSNQLYVPQNSIMYVMAEAAYRGSPFFLTDANMNNSQGTMVKVGEQTFAPGTYLFTFIVQIAMDRVGSWGTGSWEYHPSASYRLVAHNDWSTKYYTFQAIPGDGDMASSYSGTFMLTFTSTTTVDLIMTVQEGQANSWNGDGRVLQAIKLY